MREQELFGGKYKVYEDGRIVSYIRKEPKELIGKITNWGYRMVLLYDENSNRLYRTVHRIVAEAFLPNPYNLPEVNHKDGNKLNNHINNLEWCTTKHNRIHCRDNIGSRAFKITYEDAEEIRRLKQSGVKTKELIERYGLSKTEINSIMNNTRWV
jgi:hypothetical protein